MFQFRGNYSVKVDADNRLKLPSDFKEALESQSVTKVFITSMNGTSAEIYPLPEWELIEKRMSRLSPMDPLLRKFKNVTGYYGLQTEIDKQGRVVLPQQLRAKAQLEKGMDTAVIGKTNYVEVFNKANFEANPLNLELSDVDLAQLAPMFSPQE